MNIKTICHFSSFTYSPLFPKNNPFKASTIIISIAIPLILGIVYGIFSLKGRVKESSQKKEGDQIKQKLPLLYEKIKPLAEQGDAKAQLNLGFLYYEGEEVKQDYKIAFKWFKQAADQKHPLALCNVSAMFKEGEGVRKSAKKSFQALKQAADLGLPEAQCHVGAKYYMGHEIKRDFKKALKYFHLAAKQDNPSALANLGVMYEKGNGVKQDRIKANMHYQASLEKRASYKPDTFLKPFNIHNKMASWVVERFFPNFFHDDRI